MRTYVCMFTHTNHLYTHRHHAKQHVQMWPALQNTIYTQKKQDTNHSYARIIMLMHKY